MPILTLESKLISKKNTYIAFFILFILISFIEFNLHYNFQGDVRTANSMRIAFYPICALVGLYLTLRVLIGLNNPKIEVYHEYIILPYTHPILYFFKIQIPHKQIKIQYSQITDIHKFVTNGLYTPPRLIIKSDLGTINLNTKDYDGYFFTQMMSFMFKDAIGFNKDLATPSNSKSRIFVLISMIGTVLLAYGYILLHVKNNLSERDFFITLGFEIITFVIMLVFLKKLLKSNTFLK